MLRENLVSKSLSTISHSESSMRSKMKMLRNTLLFSVTTSDAVNLLSKKTSLSEDLHEKVTADSSKARDDSYEHQSPVAKNLWRSKLKRVLLTHRTHRLSSRVQEQEVSTAETELKATAGVRKNEPKGSGASESELVDVVFARRIEPTKLPRWSSPTALSPSRRKSTSQQCDDRDSRCRCNPSVQKDQQQLIVFFCRMSKRMVAPETAVSNKRRTYILNVLQNLFANVQARFDDGRNVELDGALNCESLEPSLRDQARQYDKMLKEVKIEKTELSADRAPSMADLHEAKASLVHKGLVDDSGLSCAPVAKRRKLSVATIAEELKNTSDGVSVFQFKTGDAEEQMNHVMQIGDTTRAQHWSRENVDMGDPRCPEVRTIRGTQTSNWLESDDAPVVQVSQVPKVQIGDDTIGVSSGAVGAERVASGDPSLSRVHG